MRLYHLTSHVQALTLVAEGFAGAPGDEPPCYLLFDSLAAFQPLDSSVAVLEIEGQLALEPVAAGTAPGSPPPRYHMYVATASALAQVRVRLIDPPASDARGERRA
ncbi:MAG TPA: hypothetical protein VF046_07750 [Gemmatimonadales bacterium]